MTNKEKLTEVFGIRDVMPRCSCTFDKVQERCISNGNCLGCKMWLDGEYKESKSEKEGE